MDDRKKVKHKVSGQGDSTAAPSASAPAEPGKSAYKQLKKPMGKVFEVFSQGLKKGAPQRLGTKDVPGFVLLDTKGARYRGRFSKRKLRALGVEVIDCPLVSAKSAPYIDVKRLAPILLSLA